MNTGADDDSHGAWHAQVADLERMASDERSRFMAAHPGYQNCPQHPERPVVDSGVSVLRRCQQCLDDATARYADIQPQPDWLTDGRGQYDMRDYSDHPRHERNQGGLK